MQITWQKRGECKSYCERVHDANPEIINEDMITLRDWFPGNFVEGKT